MSCMTLVHTVKVKQFWVRIPLFAVGHERIALLFFVYLYIVTLAYVGGTATVTTRAGSTGNRTRSTSTIATNSGWFNELCPQDSYHAFVNISGFTSDVRNKKPFLEFCTSHGFLESLSTDCRKLFAGNVSMNSSHCTCLNNTILREEMAKVWHDSFSALLMRVDCRREHNLYAVQWSCYNCSESYKNWACAMNIDIYDDAGKALRPCNSVCTRVMSRCMVVEPGDSYSAIPLFDCPDIDDDNDSDCFDNVKR